MSKNYETNKNVPIPDVFVLSQNNKNDPTENESAKPADFETAITATEFGKFNIIIILASIPAAWSSVFETTTMSFVFPAAQCDLELSLNEKGLLNAITYIGMISSAYIWGFLCDTLGRRKLLIAGYFLDGIFVVMSGFSQSITVLLISKFFGGFIINGPFAAITTYLSEFHSAKYRATILMVLGTAYGIANILLPLIALGVLPLYLDVTIFNGSIKLHSWNFYLFICALPAITSFILFTLMPESPKYLMTMGQNEKALRIFQKVYSLNTGKPANSYPIKELIDEIKLQNESTNSRVSQVDANRSKLQVLKGGFKQMTPLFFPPHLQKIVLLFLIQMLFMMSLNTLRLWLPQIFQAINDYQYYNNGTTASLCTMLEVIQPAKNQSITEQCVVNTDNASVYINAIIVAFVSIFVAVIASLVINKVGKKKLLHIMGMICGACAFGLYFAQDSPTTIALSSIFIALGSIIVNIVISVVVDLFPTTLRTMTVSLTMMCGRSGAMMGNLVFPLLLHAGCAPPFFTVGASIIVCAFLSLLLPNTDLKSLE